MDKQVENLAVEKKVVENQEVDHLEIVAAEFEEEVANMSPLEPRLSPDNLGLRVATTKKTKKAKAETSRPEDV